MEKLTKLTLEDIELEKRIKNIMGNSELLKGKDYLDFILEFLQGKKDEAIPAQNPKDEKKWCFHELISEEATKLRDTLLSDKDIVFYFNIKDGMKTLIGSLQYNTNALEIIQKLLEGDVKLQEEFQKQHLFEKLIDFLQKSNQNTEERNLDPVQVHRILEILEGASMHEFVRLGLSEKKKIKDLFLVVIRSIEAK